MTAPSCGVSGAQPPRVRLQAQEAFTSATCNCSADHLDDFFGVPKVYVKAQVRRVAPHGMVLDSHEAAPSLPLPLAHQVELPAGYSSPRAIVLLDLAVRLLKESLNEFAYAADIAGLSYRADAVVKGVAITVVRRQRGGDERVACQGGLGQSLERVVRLA